MTLLGKDADPAEVTVHATGLSSSPPKLAVGRQQHVSVGQMLQRQHRGSFSDAEPAAVVASSGTVADIKTAEPAPTSVITPSVVPKLTDHVRNFRQVLKELVAQGAIVTNNKTLYTQQGNLAFYTRKNVTRRLQLRRHPELIRLSKLFWATVVPPMVETMDVHRYEQIFLRIHKVLAKIYRVEAGAINLEDDWRRDTNGDCRGLSYELFHAALFETIDIWCNSVKVQDYINLLASLLDGITRLNKEDVAFLKSLRGDRQQMVPSPPKPDGPPRPRPKSSPLKRSTPLAPQQGYNSSIVYIDINGHAVPPINFEFDVDQPPMARPHSPMRTRPAARLGLSSPRLPETIEMDVEGHCIETSTEDAPRRVAVWQYEEKSNAARLPECASSPLKGAILFSPSTYPIEHRWIKRSQARALHELKKTQDDAPLYDYFHTSPPKVPEDERLI
ncbi:hypothetical protein SDRG_15119 [Saprolegnia diclina VS20]|uniref:Uncharacterized protein n=1 Tax=Saprolegnia diclina (strain VS20) TaxID=1156394 RepID=T0PXY4_SAPDV|nr:hypothetical protein SDRG_15119 [Saprolegnia diclina VS20]EQC27111.1 hypothetical protein SDRG_15119 [Saprolegnia diclina VS20]|eukprot:XP_008619505.1 hypothetical protein SDRG_15119 [Saprolegnia diclina VS20]